MSVEGNFHSNNKKKFQGKKVTKLYGYDGIPGLVSRRRSVVTGTTVRLFNVRQAGRSEPHRWAVECMDHYEAIGHEKLLDAIACSNPRTWCSVCAKEPA
jgi:hypothetical protein